MFVGVLGATRIHNGIEILSLAGSKYPGCAKVDLTTLISCRNTWHNRRLQRECWASWNFDIHHFPRLKAQSSYRCLEYTTIVVFLFYIRGCV